MVIYVDIDETICDTPKDRDYSKSTPIFENIEKINKLFENGNIIVYWTARGTKTGKDWRRITEEQFRLWGVKYHELYFNKPVYDYWIDDKAINAMDFFK